VYDELLPKYLSMGVSKHDFFHSTPKVLRAYDKAHEMKVKEIDSIVHNMCGAYIVSAVSVAVEHVLFGNKAKSKYINKSLGEIADANKPLTEEEKQRQVDLFFAEQKAMRMRWRRNKGDSV
jgi:hypothetical protein